jgi:hypothetical protein
VRRACWGAVCGLTPSLIVYEMLKQLCRRTWWMTGWLFEFYIGRMRDFALSVRCTQVFFLFHRDLVLLQCGMVCYFLSVSYDAGSIISETTLCTSLFDSKNSTKLRCFVSMLLDGELTLLFLLLLICALRPDNVCHLHKPSYFPVLYKDYYCWIGL